MKNKLWARAAALVMTICMAITMVPSVALAAEPEDGSSADHPLTVDADALVYCNIKGNDGIIGFSQEWYDDVSKNGSPVYVKLIVPAEIGGHAVKRIEYQSLQKQSNGAYNKSEYQSYKVVTGDLKNIKIVSVDFSQAKNLEAIGNYAFDARSELAGVIDLSNTKVTEIGAGAFRDTGITGVILPDGLTTLGDTSTGAGSFAQCEKLQYVRTTSTKDSEKAVVLPESLTTIGKQCFRYSFAQSVNMTVPASVTTVGAEAFNSDNIQQINVLHGGDFSGYNSAAFQNSASALVIFKSGEDYSKAKNVVYSDHRYRLTYELPVNFKYNDQTLVPQTKLYNQYLLYEKNKDGIWSQNMNYTLPSATDMPAGYEYDWKFDKNNESVTVDSEVNDGTTAPTSIDVVANNYRLTYVPNVSVEMPDGEYVHEDGAITLKGVISNKVDGLHYDMAWAIYNWTTGNWETLPNETSDTLTVTKGGTYNAPCCYLFVCEAYDSKEVRSEQGGDYVRVYSASHQWSYTAAGNTVTAACTQKNGTCPYAGRELKLTLTAPNATVSEGAYTRASIENSISAVTKENAGAIYYAGKDGTTYTKSTTAPTQVGTYEATVTIGGATATSTFRILSQPEAVTITGLTAPEKTYDGSPITDAAFGTPVVKKGDATVSGVALQYTYYNKDGNQLASAPTDAGTYKVKVTLAKDETGYTCTPVEIEFTIAKKTVEVVMNSPVVKVGSTWDEIQQTIKPLFYYGFIGQDDEQLITKQASYTFTGDLKAAGEYEYQITPAEAANYAFEYKYNNFVISEEYTIHFVTNGGTALQPVKKLLYDTISSEESHTTRDGYTLAGWYTDSAFTKPWMPEDDLIEGNMTLYAKWVKTESLVNYAVTVQNSSKTPVYYDGRDPFCYVAVRLQQGDVTLYHQNVTTASGTVTFRNVAPGTYTLEVADASNGLSAIRYYTQAVAITENGSITVTMPEHVSAQLVVKENTPAITANKLTEEAQHIKDTTTNATSVKLRLDVEAKEETAVPEVDRTAIQGKTAGKQRLYLDAQVLVNVNDSGYKNCRNTTNVLELIVPFDMTNKYNVGVYRYHDEDQSSTEFVQVQKGVAAYEDGQFYIDGNNIHIFAQKFSTYAIAYNVRSGGHSSSGGSTVSAYPVTVNPVTNGSIKADKSSAAKGATVTLTVTPDKGYNLDKLTVTDKDGKTVALTSKGNGQYSFTMPAGKVTVAASFAATEWDLGYRACPKDETCPIWPYTDAETTAWYHDGVHFCLENGLMVGYGNNIFQPDTSTSRAMLSVMLWRLSGSPVVNYAMTFQDVAADSWYGEAVRWAASEGIVTGYDAQTFGPDNNVTREQMVTILYRYAQNKGYDVSVGESTNILSYDDAASVAQYAVPAMQWGCGSGMVQGTDNKLLPQGSTTRAQMATMMMRFCAEIVK